MFERDLRRDAAATVIFHIVAVQTRQPMSCACVDRSIQLLKVVNSGGCSPIDSCLCDALFTICFNLAISFGIGLPATVLSVRFGACVSGWPVVFRYTKLNMPHGEHKRIDLRAACIVFHTLMCIIYVPPTSSSWRRLLSVCACVCVLFRTKRWWLKKKQSLARVPWNFRVPSSQHRLPHVDSVALHSTQRINTAPSTQIIK